MITKRKKNQSEQIRFSVKQYATIKWLELSKIFNFCWRKKILFHESQNLSKRMKKLMIPMIMIFGSIMNSFQVYSQFGRRFISIIYLFSYVEFGYWIEASKSRWISMIFEEFQWIKSDSHSYSDWKCFEEVLCNNFLGYKDQFYDHYLIPDAK